MPSAFSSSILWRASSTSLSSSSSSSSLGIKLSRYTASISTFQYNPDCKKYPSSRMSLYPQLSVTDSQVAETQLVAFCLEVSLELPRGVQALVSLLHSILRYVIIALNGWLTDTCMGYAMQVQLAGINTSLSWAPHQHPCWSLFYGAIVVHGIEPPLATLRFSLHSMKRNLLLCLPAVGWSNGGVMGIVWN